MYNVLSFQVIPRDMLSLFTADEFSLLINGVTKLDVQDWKKHAVVSCCYCLLWPCTKQTTIDRSQLVTLSWTYYLLSTNLLPKKKHFDLVCRVFRYKESHLQDYQIFWQLVPHVTFCLMPPFLCSTRHARWNMTSFSGSGILCRSWRRKRKLCWWSFPQVHLVFLLVVLLL